MLTAGYLQTLKERLEVLERESPVLLSLKCPTSTATLDGVEQQCKIAIGHGYHTGFIYISYLVSESDFTFERMPVELKHALNLIKTIKGRK